MSFAPSWFTRLRDGVANWAERTTPLEPDADTEGLLDAATLAEYFAASGGDNRAQAVLDALDDPVTVRVYDGAGNIKGSGTMATPWATRSGGTLTAAEFTLFEVTSSGTPDANWFMRFESGGRWVRASFGLEGSGAAATWSLPTWEVGQYGTLGTGTMSAPSASAPSLVGAPSTLEYLQGTGGTHDFADYAYDPEGDALTFALIGTPYTGITISTAGVLTVTAAATAALRNLTIRVTDTSGLSADHVCAVKIASAPRWAGAPTTLTLTQGGTYSFAPYAFDDDGDTLAFSLVTPPSGYSINAATGLLTAGTTLGTQSITVRATDPAGLYAEASCAVTVQSAVTDDYTFRSPLVTDKYLDPAAGSDGTGTEASPWNTLTAAKLQTLVAGQALWIKNGTVSANIDARLGLSSGTANNRITVAAYPGHAPSLAISDRFYHGGANYWDFRGLNFALAGSFGLIIGPVQFQGPEVPCNNVRVIDCTGTKVSTAFTDNSGIVFLDGGADYCEVVRCTFSHLGSPGFSNDSLVWADRVKHLKVIGCLLTGSALPFYYKHNHLVTNPALVNIELRNNIFRGPSARAVFGCVNYSQWVNNAFDGVGLRFSDDGGDPGGDFNSLSHNTFYNSYLDINYVAGGVLDGCVQNVLRNNVFAGSRIEDNRYTNGGGIDQQTDTQYNAFGTGTVYWRNSVGYTLTNYRAAYPTREQNSISGTISFVGTPGATAANWALSTGSIGRNAGSDGRDMGVDATKLLTVN